MASISFTQAERHEKSIIRNLMQLYQYELASFTGKTIDPLGLFDYSYLDHSWTADGTATGRVPYLIRVEGQLAGFVLKNRHSHLDTQLETNNVAEFFVLSIYRRQGIGEAAARRLFAMFPGQWEIAMMRANLPAIAFWRSVVASVSNGTFEEIDLSDVGWDGPVLRFSSACDSCTPSLDR